MNLGSAGRHDDTGLRRKGRRTGGPRERRPRPRVRVEGGSQDATRRPVQDVCVTFRTGGAGGRVRSAWAAVETINTTLGDLHGSRVAPINNKLNKQLQ